MNSMNKMQQMHVFTSTTLLGSPQSITFVPSLSLLNKPSCVMLPGIDYTHAYYNGQDTVQVVWRNHQGTIQFCGSAAYGISYYLLHTYGLPHLTIQSPHITLNAHYDSDVSLYIPSKPIALTSQQSFEYGRLYHHADSGIYFLELEDKEAVEQIYWTESDLCALPLQNPHGLCLFYWHSSTKTGYVRYFTPWYGRVEDSVTGSIQSYLTPFVANLYGSNSQSWIQCSQNGGFIKSYFMGDKVRIQGSCHYEEHGLL